MTEKELELQCTQVARSQGWRAVKLEKNAHKGIPDRLFISKNGICRFVEFKNPNKKGRISIFQHDWSDFLGELCLVCSDIEAFRAFLGIK